ncbi:MAG TPA: DUF892 family protein [Phycisphaerales bacterium]|nr:DUF892 family protein [Phycisphaerales bacterium]
MRLDSPVDLMAKIIQKLYSAENQLILALPRVIGRSPSLSLADALENHLAETRGHATRLERMADILDVPCSGARSYAMEGILKEGEEEALGFGGDETLVDSAMVAACQAVEHYEISQYRALKELAKKVGANEIVELADATLKEEEQASKKLAEISLREIKVGMMAW